MAIAACACRSIMSPVVRIGRHFAHTRPCTSRDQGSPLRPTERRSRPIPEATDQFDGQLSKSCQTFTRRIFRFVRSATRSPACACAGDDTEEGCAVAVRCLAREASLSASRRRPGRHVEGAVCWHILRRHRPARPGDSVCRGLSIQAQASLEYWIPRMRAFAGDDTAPFDILNCDSSSSTSLRKQGPITTDVYRFTTLE
ncbi:hypothetical protein ACVWZM_000575 [Bradyrhizobium sp. USDA 4501]